MPEIADKHADHIGLALSGGGFRAALYHCGALIRLNELGLLSKLFRITSVSGGSIIAGRLAVSWDKLDFDANGYAQGLNDEVITPIRAFCRRRLDASSIASQFLPFGKGAVGKLIEAYDELFSDARLAQLPQTPEFIIMATNLQTGRAVRFGRDRIRDYLLGEITDVSGYKLSQAVAASSAFPPVLSPVILPVPASGWDRLEGADLHGQAEYMSKLHLTDGGVYDNMGLERIDHFGTILVSDAGAPFAAGATFKAFSPKQVLRSLDIATDQSRGLRKLRLFDHAEIHGNKVAYWGIDQEPTDTPPAGAIPVAQAVKDRLASTRTRLNPFSDQEQSELINWGYAGCDERVRRFLLHDAPVPAGLPEPSWSLTG